MTQLSKALTAETPEERISAVADAVQKLKLCGGSTPEVDIIIREAMLNERTLFIAAGRGELSVQGVPAHMNPAQGDREAGTANGSQPGRVSCQSDPARSGGSEAAPGPLNPPASPPNLCKCVQTAPGVADSTVCPVHRTLGPEPAVASIEQLREAMGPGYGMDTAMFARWCDLKVGYYPKEKKERLEALARLSPGQLGYLLGVKK